MQRFLTSLLVMMLYLVSSNSSAQQFDSFRQIGEVAGSSAGTVTSITLAPTTSQISFFNAAGLSTVFDIVLRPSEIIRDDVPVFMPSTNFGSDISNTVEPSLNLDGVGFFTGTLVNTQDRQGDVPAHWFRITFHDGIWSGAFRVADQVYSINRDQRDNVVEVRSTPSQNKELLPARQIKVTALVDEDFVYADAPGDSVGLDTLGHIFALETLHVMDGIALDSLGLTLKVEQLVYQESSQIESPAIWLADNADTFGIEDNFTTFLFRGNAEPAIGSNFVQQNVANYAQLATAHNFGELLGLPGEDGTLQSTLNPLNAAHWSDSQKEFLSANLPNPTLVQIISSDAPDIEVTEPEIANEIPQSILDSEIVESIEFDSDDGDESSGAIFQEDGSVDSQTNLTSTGTDGGGGRLSSLSAVILLLLVIVSRRQFTVKTA